MRRRVTGFALTPLTALLGALGFLTPLGLSASAAEPVTPARFVFISEQLLTLKVSVNTIATGQWELLNRNGVLYATPQAFDAWKVRRRNNAESVEFAGQTYFALASVAGFVISINTALGSADIRFRESGLQPAPTVVAPIKSVAEVVPAPTPLSTTPTISPAPPGERTNAAAKVTGISPTSERLVPLEVIVNNTPSGQWVLLERDGVLYAPQDAFEEWRLIQKPNTMSVEYKGLAYTPLSSVPGYDAKLNLSNQSVELAFAASAFSATHLTTDNAKRPVLGIAAPSAFLNYDLSYSQSKQAGITSTRDLGAIAELGAANDWGVLTSTYVGRSLLSTDPAAPRSWRRLDTTFSRDFLDSGTSLRLGDSGTRSGATKRTVYFGGLQFGRNFNLIPGFVTQPRPTLAGTSSAPSTVQLYVNDALRQVSNVPTGPFAIENLPLMSGGGQARLVIRDLLGRETVVTVPFFAHASLLEEGLSDWSLELGALRQNQGTDNANYGQRFAAGLWRYGVGKRLTLESHLEWGQQTRSIGLGLAYALPMDVLGQAAMAFSKDNTAGAGAQWLLSAEYSRLQHGFGLRAEGATEGYRQMGTEALALPYRNQISGNYSYASESFGSLGMAMARIDNYTGGPLTTVSANYSSKVGERNSLTLTATRVLGNNAGTALGLSFQMPLGNRVGLSTSVTHRGGQSDLLVSANQSPASETGFGWRASAGNRSGQSFSDGGAFYQGNRGSASVDVSASTTQQSLRLGGQGGVVAIGGSAFVTRRVDSSFALVEVPGYPNVGIRFQGSNLARTNADGVALLPRLLPYQSNSIQLDPADLPISAELDNLEQIAVPAARSGLRVLFPVRTGRGALIKIVFDDKAPAPAGATLELLGDKKEFFVARRGEAFVTGLQDKNTLKLSWGGTVCSMAIELPPGTPDDIARVGPVLCTGIKR